MSSSSNISTSQDVTIDTADINANTDQLESLQTDTNTKLDTIEATLTSIETATSDVATETTLATRATEATLATRATEATLATRATEATLATRATEATLATLEAKASTEAKQDTQITRLGANGDAASATGSQSAQLRAVSESLAVLESFINGVMLVLNNSNLYKEPKQIKEPIEQVEKID